MSQLELSSDADNVTTTFITGNISYTGLKVKLIIGIPFFEVILHIQQIVTADITDHEVTYTVSPS